MAQKQTSLQMTTGSLFDSPLASQDSAPSGRGGDGGELDAKRASVWAVVSAALAVPSILTFMNLNFVVFSVAAVLAGLFAFWLIWQSGGELSGKSVAGFGLALGLATLIGGPLNAQVYRAEFGKQAEEFAQHWFKTVKSDNIALTRLVIAQRQTVGIEVALGDHALEGVNRLGDRATMTYYSTVADVITPSKEETSRIYAVTVEPEKPGEKKQTFFINLVMERFKTKTEEEGTLNGWGVVFNEYEPLPLDEEGRPYLRTLGYKKDKGEQKK